jgi:hypothetical protein
MTTTIIVVGIIVIAVIGFSGRRRRDLSGWTVSERDLPRWTSWFLQAGESLTTFSFLGLAGIAFTGGVSATFAVCYLTASAVGMYFVAPRLRDLGAARGYLTMSDFFFDRYRSRQLSVVMAVVGALFLVPYLALQITGLGLIVGLATGSSSARGLSMVLASALVVVFVSWAGIHGIARVAVFKDFGMLLALVVVAVATVGAAGGFPEVFTKVAETSDQLLTTHAPGYDATFFITAVVVTTIGASFNVFPHLWPPVLAAKSGEILRSNYKWLGVYQLLLLLPITVGMGAVLLIDHDTKSNDVLFTVSQQNAGLAGRRRGRLRHRGRHGSRCGDHHGDLVAARQQCVLHRSGADQIPAQPAVRRRGGGRRLVVQHHRCRHRRVVAADLWRADATGPRHRRGAAQPGLGERDGGDEWNRGGHPDRRRDHVCRNPHRELGFRPDRLGAEPDRARRRRVRCPCPSATQRKLQCRPGPRVRPGVNRRR